MDNISGKESQNLGKKDLEKTLTGLIVVTIITALIAMIGTGFGIYSTIQVNRTIQTLGLDSSTEGDSNSAEPTYGKPTNPESIEAVYISYNNGNDFIDIYNSNEIEYYAYTDDDDYIGDSIEANTSEIFQYIFDNNLEYLGDNDYNGEETWSIEVDTTENTYSFVGGSSETPEWFNNLLTKLDVNTNGYKSNS